MNLLVAVSKYGRAVVAPQKSRWMRNCRLRWHPLAIDVKVSYEKWDSIDVAGHETTKIKWSFHEWCKDMKFEIIYDHLCVEFQGVAYVTLLICYNSHIPKRRACRQTEDDCVTCLSSSQIIFLIMKMPNTCPWGFGISSWTFINPCVCMSKMEAKGYFNKIKT